MKKCVYVLLAALILLSGCKKNVPQQTTAPATEPEPTGLYDPAHPIEQQTVGAIRAYPLGEGDHVGITTMGSKLLLLKADGTARVLQGENCEILAEGDVGLTSFDGGNYCVDPQGIAVYQQDTKTVIMRNPQLQVVNQVQLPQDIQGEPVISLASNEIFFCQANEIRALNLENSVPRLIRSHTVADQTLTGSYFDGTAVSCVTTDAAGLETVLYLSAENGLTLSQDPDLLRFETYGDRYFIERSDYTVLQNIVGTLENGARSLALPEDQPVVLENALAMDGMVSYRLTDTGVELLFHDLEQEKTTARLLLEGMQAPIDMVADTQFVWMIMQEEEQQVLYRWDVTGSALAEAVSVITPLYTAQAPDAQGLEVCQDTVDQMNSDYDVRISIWEDAVKKTGEHTVVAEHQPAIINRVLTELTPALQVYPDNFLRKTVRTGWIRIGIVRTVDSERGWVQFWEGGDCYILISSQTDAAQAFLEAVGYAIDTHVLGNSRDYDTWSTLNPEGFTYGEALPADENGTVLYLEGESRAFVNQDATASPMEDRRQLFIAAMTQGNEALFTSQTMQNKLRRMCEGIRESYGLERKKELYQWEQYLVEPMVKLEPTNG